MAVCCGGPRVNYWSNPYVYYPGTGMMGSLNFNYNALALNISDSTVAHHRLTPSSIDSDNVLTDDHLINNHTSGLVIATDTTMTGGSLILQSETKVRLAAGFRAFNGSFGYYRISSGCSESDPLNSSPPSTVVQRDARPVTQIANPSTEISPMKSISSIVSRDQRDR